MCTLNLPGSCSVNKWFWWWYITIRVSEGFWLCPVFRTEHRVSATGSAPTLRCRGTYSVGFIRKIQDNSITIVTRLDDWRILVRFPAGARDISLLYSTHTGSGTQSALYLVGTGCCFPWGLSSQGVLTTHCHPVPTLRMHGAIHPLPRISSRRDANLIQPNWVGTSLHFCLRAETRSVRYTDNHQSQKASNLNHILIYGWKGKWIGILWYLMCFDASTMSGLD
jgi:hypothetical protein